MISLRLTKCVCNSPEILKIDPLFRTVTDKELYKREMSKALNEVAQPVIKNSDGRFKGYKIKKIADEKLRDFLKSGQSKFPASDNTSINILAIAVPITNFENYWAYLYNAFSGLFVKSNNGICPPTDYDKIDVVYLTALVTGHTKFDLFYVYTTSRNVAGTKDLGKSFIDCLRRTYKSSL